jgi:hypothetical protein
VLLDFFAFLEIHSKTGKNKKRMEFSSENRFIFMFSPIFAKQPQTPKN